MRARCKFQKIQMLNMSNINTRDISEGFLEFYIVIIYDD